MTTPAERERAINRVEDIVLAWRDRKFNSIQALHELARNMRHYPSRMHSELFRQWEEERMK